MTAIIVGAGPGLGLSIARRFGREGMAVGLIARDAGNLAARAASLRETGIRQVASRAADAGDAASLTNAIRSVIAAYDAPSALIYNAHASTRGQPSELDLSDLDRCLKVNVVGCLTAVQAVLPAMIDAGRGSILVTGGGLGINPHPAATALSAGKAALRNLVGSLAGELHPKGIRVATVTVCGRVEPGGFYDPDVIAQMFWQLHTEHAPFSTEIVVRQS